MERNNLERREALKKLSLITGFAFTAGATSAFLAGCKSDSNTKSMSKGGTLSDEANPPFVSVFTNDQVAMLAEVAERIIPKTDTPGAKDALVHEYISRAVSLFYKKDDQKKILDNIGQFDAVANDKYKKNFVQLSDQNKDDVLKIMADDWKKNENKPHIFKEVRDLTVFGYCTSEAGATQLLLFDEIPGPYKADIPRSSVRAAYSL